MRRAVADAPAPAKTPNRTLAILLLIVAAAGTAGLLGWAFWRFFQDDRSGGLNYLTYGAIWFIFWTWRLRILTHPKPTA